MTGPENLTSDPDSVETRVTGVVPVELPEGLGVEPIPPAPAYKPEPVFNKKVMLAWALGAAALWLTVKFITPIAVDSAKTAIVETVKEVNERENPGTTVTITRNGKVISITRTQGNPAAPAASAKPAAAPKETGSPPTKVEAPAPPPARK
jgi:hypothetical protein